MVGRTAQAWRGVLPAKGREGPGEIRAEELERLGILFLVSTLSALAGLFLGLMVLEVVEVQEL